MKDLAQKVIVKFHNNGLWSATKQKDGTFKIGINKITDAQYKALSNNYKNLNNDGLIPAEQRQRDDNVKSA